MDQGENSIISNQAASTSDALRTVLSRATPAGAQLELEGAAQHDHVRHHMQYNAQYGNGVPVARAGSGQPAVQKSSDFRLQTDARPNLLPSSSLHAPMMHERQYQQLHGDHQQSSSVMPPHYQHPPVAEPIPAHAPSMMGHGYTGVHQHPPPPYHNGQAPGEQYASSQANGVHWASHIQYPQYPQQHYPISYQPPPNVLPPNYYGTPSYLLPPPQQYASFVPNHYSKSWMSADGLGEGPPPPAPQESANQWRPMCNVYGAREVTTGMVVQLHLSGCTNREIASQLGIHHNTVYLRLKSVGYSSRKTRPQPESAEIAAVVSYFDQLSRTKSSRKLDESRSAVSKKAKVAPRTRSVKSEHGDDEDSRALSQGAAVAAKLSDVATSAAMTVQEDAAATEPTVIPEPLQANGTTTTTSISEGAGGSAEPATSMEPQ